jgi:hypothetical protein
MEEREYLEALSRGMQRLVDEAEEEVQRLARPFEVDEWVEDQRARSLALFDSLEPPPELAALHGRLRLAAEHTAGVPGEDVQVEDLVELARRMELYGFELMPGVTAESIERELHSPDGGLIDEVPAPGDGWEAKLRRALTARDHPDVEGAIQHMRRLRAE